MSDNLKQREIPEPPSDDFMNAVCDTSSNVAICDFCGRTHFSLNEADYYKGELEELKAKRDKTPEKYVSFDEDSVAFGYLDGKRAVWGCPCNSARRYEDFIWMNREIIAEYLSARAETLTAEAKETTELAKGIEKTLG
jgi:hypothetical protein